MSWNWTKFGWIAGGFLLGTYGVRLLGSRDMKKAYTHTTAAVLRMKDEVVKDFTVIGETVRISVPRRRILTKPGRKHLRRR